MSSLYDIEVVIFSWGHLGWFATSLTIAVQSRQGTVSEPDITGGKTEKKAQKIIWRAPGCQQYVWRGMEVLPVDNHQR